MRFLIGIILFSIVPLSIQAQNSYYKYIQLGKLEVAYCDTVLYDPEIVYTQYGYSGNAPIFVQIWYPSDKILNQRFLTMGEYQLRKIPEALKGVYHELLKHTDESFIRDGISYNVFTDEPLNYGNLTTSEILARLKEIKTKSVYSEIDSTLDYPVIVYHHGSQGMSDENSIMAEYFASKGYVFISANFHLPYPNSLYGLLPYDLEKKSKHNQSGAKTVIDFAKSISSSKQIYFIGHSWGAQEGWCFLNDSSWVKAFVSMETTLEFKTDSTEIKELWPYVYDAIKVKKNKFSIPILLFAATEENKKFEFFENVSSEEMIHATYKKFFAHNSYTSFYMLRYFLSEEIKQADSEVLLEQIKAYAAHINVIEDFFEHIQQGKEFNKTKFEELFYIN